MTPGRASAVEISLAISNTGDPDAAASPNAPAALAAPGPVVVSATNAADPVILPNHLAGDRPVLVCDLAVPGDVHPAVESLANVTLVSGGRIRLPHGQVPHYPGITLPPGVVYSCMAETILLGFEPDTPSPSFGGLTVAGVLAARDLAVRHDLHPVRVVSDDVSAQPWIVDPLTSNVEERIA